MGFRAAVRGQDPRDPVDPLDPVDPVDSVDPSDSDNPIIISPEAISIYENIGSNQVIYTAESEFYKLLKRIRAFKEKLFSFF